MSTSAAPPAPLDPAAIRASVERLLYDFLDDQEQGAPICRNSACSSDSYGPC